MGNAVDSSTNTPDNNTGNVSTKQLSNFQKYLPSFIFLLLSLIIGFVSTYFMTQSSNVRIYTIWVALTIIAFLISFIFILYIVISSSLNKRKLEHRHNLEQYRERLNTALAVDDDIEETTISSPVQITNDLMPDSNGDSRFDLDARGRKIKPTIAVNVEKKITKKISHSALKLMAINLEDIKEYYDWSRDQAKIILVIAAITCILGILFIIAAVLLPVVFKISFEATLITAIGGMITTIFSGTTLIVYRISITQLNHYHECLHEDQRFLSTVDLLSKITSEKNRDNMLSEIIRSQLDINKTNATATIEIPDVNPTPVNDSSTVS